MTNTQEDTLSMILTFEDFDSEHKEIGDSLPHFRGYATNLTALRVEIQSAAEIQKQTKRGLTISKEELRTALIGQIMKVQRGLNSYATFIKNTELISQAETNESSLKKVADTGLRDYAQNFYTLANEYLDELASYRITAETQAALQKAINDFTAAIPKPRSGQNKRSEATKKLKTLLKEAQQTLEQIDIEVEMLKEENPEYYSLYKKARKIIPTGRRGGDNGADSGEENNGESTGI